MQYINEYAHSYSLIFSVYDQLMYILLVNWMEQNNLLNEWNWFKILSKYFNSSGEKRRSAFSLIKHFRINFPSEIFALKKKWSEISPLFIR